MLVYGDHKECADVGGRLASIARQLRTVEADQPGIERHSHLVGALIDAGQLLQGVADRRDAAEDLHLFLHGLARAVVRSVDSGFEDIGQLPAVPSPGLSGYVELSLPEGFAFYAVYPESYIAAARRLRLAGPARIIGIRSIGTTLGAVVAAALEAPVALTVRPFGNPFARKAELPADVIEPGAHYVVVDEGPGLSGSSFGAVADALESQGVPPDRIAFLPSHDGELGCRASEAHRLRWSRSQRVAAELDLRFLTERFGRLEPFSLGQPWERLKYLAGRDDAMVLVKFAGLGAIGERKLAMARALHACGLTPEPLGLLHGFLFERWCSGAEPLSADETPVAEIGRYIGERARLSPAAPQGASIDQLVLMCRRNISLAFGETAADRLSEWDAEMLSARVTRVRTDNKLDRVEWLRLPDRRLLKTDGLDHHQAHDLVGCQDIAWDIAGAAVEFDLDEGDTARLIAATGCDVDRDLLAFYRVAYPALRLGQAVLSGTDGQLYSRALGRLLHEHSTRDSAQILV